MRRALALAAAALAAAPAAVGAWPQAGGGPSRAGFEPADPGETPVARAWTAADASARTAPIVTGGGGPDAQRVVYGTADGRVHLRGLGSGTPVGPAEGIALDDAVLNDTDTFGSGVGATGLADAGTRVLALYNDEGAARVARIDPAAGAKVGGDLVLGRPGCRSNSPPVLGPPDAAGGRVLFFTIGGGTCGTGPALVRVGVGPDGFGTASFAPVGNLNLEAPPALVVLDDAAGKPSFFAAVADGARVAFFDADGALTSGTAPAIVAPLPGGSEAQGAAAPVTAAGGVAGAEGSGIGKAPAVYVAALAGGETRVTRFVQSGSSATLTAADTSAPIAGAPAPALAVGEVATADGVAPGGRVLVGTASRLVSLRTADLAVEGEMAAPPGDAFDRTVPAVAGSLAYATTNGGRHLVLRLPTLAAVGAGDFVAALEPGDAFGGPAIARAYVVIGNAGGVAAYRNRDVTPPRAELIAPAAGPVAATVELVAVAADVRGVAAVEFRLVSEGGSSRTVARDDSPDEGSAFGAGARYSATFQTASVPNGTYELEAIARDPTGNAGASGRRVLTVDNKGGGGGPGLQPGACANEVLGTVGADNLNGTPAGDRLLGGPGDDRLLGNGGADCLFGQDGADRMDGGAGDDQVDGAAGRDRLLGGSGRDVLSGGADRDDLRGGRGADRLDGGADRDILRGGSDNDRLNGGRGSDVLRGESGSDRIVGGAGNDTITVGSGANGVSAGSGNDRISASNRRRDAITCGTGRDRVIADRTDRVSANCESVRRVRR